MSPYSIATRGHLPCRKPFNLATHGYLAVCFIGGGHAYDEHEKSAWRIARDKEDEEIMILVTAFMRILQ